MTPAATPIAASPRSGTAASPVQRACTLLTAPTLPTGLTLLEASAGTGKTYTIAGLVARYVAAGVRLPRVLVVTFTRAATAELRDRVRRRLVDAAAHLEAIDAAPAGAPETVPDTAPDTAPDELLELLAAGSAEQRRRRRDRLRAALAEFDAATVATIHGFCQQVLGGIGLAADVDRATTLLEDQRELVEAVVDDLLVRTYAHPDPLGAGAAPVVTRSQLLDIAHAVVSNPDAAIAPAQPDAPEVAARVALAQQVRAELDRRKRALGVVSYDDVLGRLAAALRDPEHGEHARRRLRAAYDVVLIDEFQDTDPVQWEIVADAFADDGRALVLIGDPKQAIYSFRGADVHAYLQAARRAGTAATLTRSWRSDGPLLHAYNLLLDGITLGHPEIAYRSVVPRPGHEATRLRGAPQPTPLRLKVVCRDGGVHLTGRAGPAAAISAPSAREHIARDLAADVVALLGSGATLLARDADGAPAGPPAPVRPQHLAVLVRTNAEATLVQRSLREAGVPSVINGVGSVFATVAASHWLRLLEALERPTSRARAAAVALTPFVDWTAEQLADGDAPDWDALHVRLQRWSALLRERGVAALLRAITDEVGLPGRLLGRVGGERLLTDLTHVGELLHGAAVTDHLGVAALGAWLREQLAEAEEDLHPDERARRLESDADAVQVLTVHRSKGLEFPIVYIPFLWSCGRPDAVPVVHGDRGRVVDVGTRGSSSEHDERREQAKRDRRGEDLRLLYVALTRARHQAVVWWAPTTSGKESPLGRVLFGRDPDGQAGAAGPAAAPLATLPTDDEALACLAGLAGRSEGTISVEVSAAPAHLPTWSDHAGDGGTLAVAPFARTLDRRWRRASYTSLTRGAHAMPAGTGPASSEPEERVVDDEQLDPAGPDQPAGLRASDPVADLPLSPQVLPGGADSGTFVHAVLERTDFAAADLDAELHAAVAAELDRGGGPHPGLRAETVPRLVDGLRRALATPLGPLTGGLPLRAFTRADRLDELAFELPLATAGTPFAVAAVADLLRRHLPADDPLASYADDLDGDQFQATVQGFLTGSIDLVLRTAAAGESCYVLADYKTNVLGVGGRPSADAYHPRALAAAMRRGHYPLQALLYLVALHRYLRWRQPGYDPERHLGGVLYLFVRGITGPAAGAETQSPAGVFSWRPPCALVLALDQLLDSGRVA